MRPIRLLSAFLLALTIAACGGEEGIEGEWREVGGNETLVIEEDGDVTISEQGQQLTGRYTETSEDAFTITVAGAAAPLVMQGRVEGDQLTVTLPDGQSVAYERTDD